VAYKYLNFKGFEPPQMEFQHLSRSVLDTACDLLVLCVNGDPARDPLFKLADQRLGGHLSERVAAEEFAGKVGQTISTHRQGLAARALLVLGAEKDNDAATIRDLGAAAIRAARRHGAARVAVVLPQVAPARVLDTLARAVEGCILGSYKFAKYRGEESKKPDPVKLVSIATDRSPKAPKGRKPASTAAEQRASKAAIVRGQRIAAAVSHARDLINEPAAVITPAALAAEARELARKHGLEVKILGPKECEKLGMGMFLAVGRGSDHEVRFIHLTYKPKKKARKRVVLIGKGVTFDSGGYSLKPTDGMLDMKVDMSGAAAVLSAMGAIAELGSSCEVHAVAACAENMVSGRAYRLGDVLQAMDGTTVEINNTDAEGRLTLGDAICYARDAIQPDEMFDFATLTGACMVALGPYTAGLMSDHDDLAGSFLAAARAAGEDMWRMPLNPRLREQLKSPIADMRNTGERWGGALTAGLFLQHFAKDTPWVHVDIAGPASAARENGATSRGGVGFGVATILEYLRD
jgi:leucyl aminopeptidase